MNRYTTTFLVLFTVVAIASANRQCHYQNGNINQPYNEESCSSDQNYCETRQEYDNRNNLLKVTKECSSSCTRKGCYETVNSLTNYVEEVCCCDSNYCNGSNSNSRLFLLLALTTITPLYYTCF